MTIYGDYSDVEGAHTFLLGHPPIRPRLFLLEPTVVFAARVVLLDPAEYPISFVAYDTVTTGDYTDIKPGMTLLLGTAAGADNYGRQRVRGPETPATTISIFVGLSSQGVRDGELILVDGAYLTVVDERRLWAKMPTIDSAGETFKDASMEVGENTTNPPPVANCGPAFAGTIDPDSGVITVTFPGDRSFAVANTATITDYLWEIQDGTLAGGSSLTDATPTVTFPAGYRFVELMVTDSNGKSHTASCLVYGRDPDNDTSFDEFAIESYRGTQSGVTLSLRALANMPQVTYPDGCHALLWEREPNGPTDRDHMLIVGWLESEDNNVAAGKFGLARDTTLTILDVAGRSDTLPGFAQSVTNDDLRDSDLLPEITWNYMTHPDADKLAHYLLYWHSTALEVADFVWSGTGSLYAITTKSTDGDSLWNQVQKLAGAMCPGYVLSCDRSGRIAMFPDPQFQDLEDRTDVVQAAITEDDWNSIRYGYRRAPNTHWLRTSGQVIETDPGLNDDGTIDLTMVYSISPGVTPGQGLGETENNEQIVDSQDALNRATGHRYARMNAPIGPMSLTLVQNDGGDSMGVPWRELEPALMQWVTINMTAATAARRGFTFLTARALVKEVNISFNESKTGISRTVELTVEIETGGQPGATVIPPTVPAVGDQPPAVPPAIPPPDGGIITGQELVAGIGSFRLYRTSDFQTPSGMGGPTWEAIDLVEGDEIMTWVVDPFSPGYVAGSGAISGFVATANNVYRISDLFGTVIVNSILEFDNTAQWRTIQASFGTYFVSGSNPWLICVSYYGSLGGHTGTWATYSKDGGATWADEVLISADYDSGGAVNPIGLYTSPKTPGLAYTAAHTETANPATAGGYISTDWGATWTLMSASDPDKPLPVWGTISASGGDFELGDTSAQASLTAALSDSDGGAAISLDRYLILAPPKTAKRIVVTGTWSAAIGRDTGLESAGAFMALYDELTIARTDDFVFTNPGYGSPSSGSFAAEYTFTGGDWPTNSDSVVSSPPSGPAGVRFRCYSSVSSVSGHLVTCTTTFRVRVTEIELDDGTIYAPADSVIAPVHGQAGEIHLPWADNDAEDLFYYGALDRTTNRLFALKRATSGTVEDISPNDGSKDYGVNHGHFAVRAHDSDRSFVVAAVTGNDASGSESGDKQGVYVSSDGGDSWDEIVAPATSTEPYSAAFGGDDEQIIFVWGPAGYVSYSSDFGATLDDRSGNLTALSATHLIGIAGGPTP